MELDERVARKYLSLKDSAKVRGIEFSLSLTSLKNIYRSKRCYYTGQTMSLGGNNHNSLTIDRVDNTKGYVSGNVVACVKWFNEAKGSLTPEDIKILYKRACK